jgi:hypothetical protein
VHCRAVVNLLVDNLKEGELELVPSLLAHSQVRKDKEGGVLVVNVLEVVEGGHGRAGEEARTAVVDDVQLRVLIVAANKARKEEVVWVLHVQLPVTPPLAVIAHRRYLLALVGLDLELDDGRGVDRPAISCEVRTERSAVMTLTLLSDATHARLLWFLAHDEFVLTVRVYERRGVGDMIEAIWNADQGVTVSA